jgi:hypothetical protein
MKLYQTPALIVVGGVPEILGAAANALSGASSTARNETADRAKTLARARENARTFVDDMGMQIPSKQINHAASKPTPLAPAHRISVPPDSIPGRPSHA